MQERQEFGVQVLGARTQGLGFWLLLVHKCLTAEKGQKDASESRPLHPSFRIFGLQRPLNSALCLFCAHHCSSLSLSLSFKVRV